jgi:uncharacterized protein YgbK (DUF1537 family)
MASDPLNPVRESYIPAIIAAQSAVTTECIHAGAFPKDGGRGICIFDSESNEEMATIAAFLREKGLLAATAGCAGFAEFLMRVIPFPASQALGGKGAAGGAKQLPVLVISGSVNPVSVSQVKTALDAGISGFSVSAENLSMPAWFHSDEASDMILNCASALKSQGICVMGTNMALGQAVGKTQEGEKRGGGSAALPEHISGMLGKLVPAIIWETGPLHLVVFGGDTLLDIMKDLGSLCIVPLEEIRPGIVLARALTGAGEILIVTKSGAFGDDGIIRIIQEYLAPSKS